MKPYILITITLFLNACCFSSFDVILEEPDFDAKGKVLIFDDDSNSTAAKLLRGALRKEGIKVLKYANYKSVKVHEKIEPSLLEKNTELSIKNNFYGSSYVIDLSYTVCPEITCLTGADATFYKNIGVEISNLESREVVLSLSASGPDKKCGYCEGRVFEKIAKKISEYWKQQTK